MKALGFAGGNKKLDISSLLCRGSTDVVAFLPLCNIGATPVLGFQVEEPLFD